MAGAFHRSSENNSRSSKKGGKKPLPEPTHVGNFVIMLILQFCKKILFIDTSVKIGIYLIGVLAGSVICDLFVVPKTYFSDKHNIFNEWFVKVGWGWTLFLLISFVSFTSFVYCCGRISLVRRHLLRLVVATFWWYFCTNLFNFIESITGVCSINTYLDKRTCVHAGKSWLGFDISGHVFILIHSLLTISEELKCYKNWKKLEQLINEDDICQNRKVSQQDVTTTQYYLKTLSPYIKLTVFFLTLLSILWEMMLLASTVYRFHTLPQKVIASFVAVGCWFLSYQVMFTAKTFWAPGLPGQTPLSYTKVR